MTESAKIKDEAAKEVREARTELTIGITTNDELYFEINGEQQDLVSISGLLDYAQSKIDYIWMTKSMPVTPVEEPTKEA